MNIKEICECCYGSGGMLEDNSACMNCNGKGYNEFSLTDCFKNKVAGILYYKVIGKGIGGQQVGADGSGSFMIIFYGDINKAAKEVAKYVDALHKNFYVKHVDYVENLDGYYGPCITHQY